MNDIVTELRARANTERIAREIFSEGLLYEAASEIELLRGRLKAAELQIDLLIKTTVMVKFTS